jgi:hypothetical protein
VQVVVILRLLIDLVSLPVPQGRVSVSEVAAALPGSQVELSVTILETPEVGSPLSVELSSDDFEPVPNRFDSRDVVDALANQPRIRARLTAPEVPGRYAVDGHVRYIACTADRCRPRRARVRWTLVVEPPAAP